MRILHTADWHLGVTTNRLSRADDHERFFGWLLGFLEDYTVDALVVAGDIFDTQQPSAAAQDQYYRFLARAAQLEGLQIVMVGGNHDSASRLDAPSSLLEALDIHVIGGLTQESVEAGRHLVPLRNAQGEVGAVLLAVPYVPEWRLGGRAADAGSDALSRSVTEGFAALYSGLADQAAAHYPGVPQVATGHLTIQRIDGAAAHNDEDIELHRIGAIDALSPSIFDPRIGYVALGHIHQCYPVDPEHRAWYSGSPIPIGKRDGRSDRRVILLEVDPETGTLERTVHPIPGTRSMQSLEGSLEEVLAQIKARVPEAGARRVGLTPFFYIDVHADEVPLDFERRIEEAIEAHPQGRRPIVVESKVTRKTTAPGGETGRVTPQAPREQLNPRDVFKTLLTASGFENDPALEAAFGQLLDIKDDDELEALIQQISEPQP
jgi:DNA repair protein SbcD/Mre11